MEKKENIFYFLSFLIISILNLFKYDVFKSSSKNIMKFTKSRFLLFFCQNKVWSLTLLPYPSREVPFFTSLSAKIIA